MRRVTNASLLFWVNWSNLMEHFLQGNVQLRHPLNEKPLFMSWWRSAFREVNNWALSLKRIFLLHLLPIAFIHSIFKFSGHGTFITNFKFFFFPTKKIMVTVNGTIFFFIYFYSIFIWLLWQKKTRLISWSFAYFEMLWTIWTMHWGFYSCILNTYFYFHTWNWKYS